MQTHHIWELNVPKPQHTSVNSEVPDFINNTLDCWWPKPLSFFITTLFLILIQFFIYEEDILYQPVRWQAFHLLKREFLLRKGSMYIWETLGLSLTESYGCHMDLFHAYLVYRKDTLKYESLHDPHNMHPGEAEAEISRFMGDITVTQHLRV